MVKGYKVFNPDWTCSPEGNTKQYSCPGKFEEDVKLNVCGRGMHFCKRAADCFSYCAFTPDNHVAEVIAYGDIKEDGYKCCTDKLEIVREIPWTELLEIVNTGKGCTGLSNSGDYNSGDYNSGNCNSGDDNSGNRNSGYCNSGNRNSGDYNSGNRNSGDYNSGDYNSGDYNSGDHNSGDYNSGDHNSGYCNSGNRNSGDYNSGDCNSGNRNSGYYNSGDCNSGNRNSGYYNSGSYNSGNHNSGYYNSGNYNSGNYNSGNYNKTNFSNGCFNTVEPKIYLFNKPSEWTYTDWLTSAAWVLMRRTDMGVLRWITSQEMSDEEKQKHPEYETTGGYLRSLDNKDCRVAWWHRLSENEKDIIKAIPNFDKDIFKEITGIDVDEKKG